MHLIAEVQCPTLVIHPRGDLRVPFDKGRQLAAHIRNSTFIPLDSSNHVLLTEPAWDVFLSKLTAFISAPSPSPRHTDLLASLTPRERKVLEYIARGMGNSTISEQLDPQDKTVRNHITHIYDKLDVNRQTQLQLTVTGACVPRSLCQRSFSDSEPEDHGALASRPSHASVM